MIRRILFRSYDGDNKRLTLEIQNFHFRFSSTDFPPDYPGPFFTPWVSGRNFGAQTENEICRVASQIVAHYERRYGYGR